jgi:Shikimate 5'-dehydrogenase C-terminal domain
MRMGCDCRSAHASRGAVAALTSWPSLGVDGKATTTLKVVSTYATTASVAVVGSVSADVLVNTTSVGMHPAEDQSPIAARALAQFSVVFDAIYTPLETQLLKVGGITHGSSRLAETWHALPCVPFIRPCTSSIQPLSCVPSQDRALPASSHEPRCLPQPLQDARAAGCTPISGLEMFVGQAAVQFKLFTGKDAPVDLMRQTVLDSLAKQ